MAQSDELMLGLYVGNSKFSIVAKWNGPEKYVSGTTVRKNELPIGFTADNETIVGQVARLLALYDPQNTIFGVKRLIGRTFDDPLLQDEISRLAFMVVEGENREPRIITQNKRTKALLSPERFLDIIYAKLKEMDSKLFVGHVNKIVLTVPAYFDISQVEATKVAAVASGFDVLHVIDEPISVVVAHGLDRKYNGCGKRSVVVFHLGGLTCVVSIVEIHNSILKVKATTKDTNLGGTNFTNNMVDYVVEQFKLQHYHESDLSSNTDSMRHLWEVCEEGKRRLYSNKNVVSCRLKVRHCNESIYITCSQFEQVNQELFSKCIKLVENCLEGAGMDKGGVDEVVLMGSSCRIFKLQKLLQEFFQGQSLIYSSSENGIVARGAAILGLRLDRKEYKWTQNGRNGAFSYKDNKLAWDNAAEDPSSEDESDGDGQPVIGIDFGTSNSCVAVWENGRAQIMINDEGLRITPSYIAFGGDDEDEIIIGNAAKNAVFNNPKYTIFDVKRMVGKKFNDINKDEMKLWPFEVREGDNGEPKIVVKNNGEMKLYRPEEIMSMILKELKKFAEKWLNRGPITNVVLTVPAYFGSKKRKAIKDAAVNAELNILRFIYEPTAAAAAYGLESKYQSDEKKNVLVFDLGGGTLDVSLLEIENSKVMVKGTAGDNNLGGEDFDNRMVQYLIEIFKNKTHVDITNDARSVWKLKRACEEAKKILSVDNRDFVRIEVESLYKGINFIEKMYRSKFEELNEDLLIKCMEPVKQCLKDAMRDKEEVDEVVLVGGSSRIPKIRQLLQDFFKGKKFCYNFHPDEAVAYGAVILGAKLIGRKDECLQDFDVEDTTPLSLGVEGEMGKMLVVVPRNTLYPTKKVITYRTLYHNQTIINFKIYEGEKRKAMDNNLLGSFELDGIRPAPAGVSTVELSFTVDKNGMLQVTALDAHSRKVKAISISDDSRRLDKKYTSKMILEAEKVEFEEHKMNKKQKAKKELEDYAALVLRKLEDTYFRLRLGSYTHGSLKLVTKNAIEWSKNRGPVTRTSEFVHVMENLKAAVKPYKKEMGL